MFPVRCEEKGGTRGCHARSWIFRTHRTPGYWWPLSLMGVRSIEGKVAEDDIGPTEREQRGPGDHPHLLPREVSIVGTGSSVAKEKRRATEGVEI